MSSNYPTSIDTFVDPGPTDTMDGDGGSAPALEHDVQHTNINDSVSAIETFVGTSSAPNFVNGASIAAVTAATEAYALTTAASVKSLSLLKANNLLDVADAGSSRYNLSIPTQSAVAAAAAGNVNIASPGATFDGYAMQSNDELLLTNQTTTSQSGIWTWNGSTSALTRPNEFPTGGLIKRGRTVTVVNGTLRGNTQWILSSTATGLTIDTSAQTWTQIAYDALGSAATASVGAEAYAFGITQAASVQAMQIAVYDPAAISQQLLGISATQTVTNKRITNRVLAQSAPGAQPAIDTDNYDVVHFTGLAASISSMSASISGSPVDGDRLRISFTDNGTARLINWGTGSPSTWAFEGDALPTSTTASVRLDSSFYWNTETSKWRAVGVTSPNIVYQDSTTSPAWPAGSGNFFYNTSASTIFNPFLEVGIWQCIAVMSISGAGNAGQDFVNYFGGTGTASYSLPNGYSWNGSAGTGTPLGGRTRSPTTAAGDNALVMTLSPIVTVNTAGTIGVQGIASAIISGNPVVAAQDAVTSVTVQASYITCVQIA